MTPDPQHLAERYAALWNETDDAARQAAVVALFAPDALHRVRTLQARGTAELVQRVVASHHKNVRDAGHRFRACAGAQRLDDTVVFHWQMVHGDEPAPRATGLELLQLDDQGRIVRDLQFILG